MKKILVLALLVMVSMFGIDVYAAEVTTINLSSTNNVYVAPGYVFDIDVTVSAPTDLVGVQTKILYDSTRYDLMSVQVGSLLSSKDFNLNIETPGVVLVVYVDVLNKINSANEVTLFTLTFKALDTLPFGSNQVITYDNTYQHEFLSLDAAYNLTDIENVHFYFNNITRAAKGDLDLSGSAGLADVAKIQLYLADKGSLTDLEMLLADVNGDSRISILDSARIQLYIAGLISSL